MSWLRRMLQREEPPHPAGVRPADTAELEAWKAEHRRLLSKADEAIQRAMAHADDVMTYSGPERRHALR